MDHESTIDEVHNEFGTAEVTGVSTATSHPERLATVRPVKDDGHYTKLARDHAKHPNGYVR